LVEYEIISPHLQFLDATGASQKERDKAQAPKKTSRCG
jgi:hypothetical protein